MVLLAENPWSLRNVGLLLSFASTGGILLFSKPLSHAMVESKTYAHLEDHHPFLARGLRPGITATCCSLASSAFSLPICAVYFGVVSVSGFVTNALCLWLISLIFSAGLATAAASTDLPAHRAGTRLADRACGAAGAWRDRRTFVRSLQRGFSGQSVCCGLGGIFSSARYG